MFSFVQISRKCASRFSFCNMFRSVWFDFPTFPVTILCTSFLALLEIGMQVIESSIFLHYIDYIALWSKVGCHTGDLACESYIHPWVPNKIIAAHVKRIREPRPFFWNMSQLMFRLSTLLCTSFLPLLLEVTFFLFPRKLANDIGKVIPTSYFPLNE